MLWGPWRAHTAVSPSMSSVRVVPQVTRAHNKGLGSMAHVLEITQETASAGHVLVRLRKTT